VILRNVTFRLKLIYSDYYLRNFYVGKTGCYKLSHPYIDTCKNNHLCEVRHLIMRSFEDTCTISDARTRAQAECRALELACFFR